MNQENENPIVIYEDADKTVEVRLDTGQDTVWLSQAQMAELFGRDQSVVSRHIRTVFREGELERASNMQKMHIANSDKPVGCEFLFKPVLVAGTALGSMISIGNRAGAGIARGFGTTGAGRAAYADD